MHHQPRAGSITVVGGGMRYVGRDVDLVAFLDTELAFQLVAVIDRAD